MPAALLIPNIHQRIAQMSHRNVCDCHKHSLFICTRTDAFANYAPNAFREFWAW